MCTCACVCVCVCVFAHVHMSAYVHKCMGVRCTVVLVKSNVHM